LDGGNDNDSIMGGAGDATLLGGSGDDSLYGGGGNDSLDGGTGTNTAYYDGPRSHYTITLFNDFGDADPSNDIYKIVDNFADTGGALGDTDLLVHINDAFFRGDSTDVVLTPGNVGTTYDANTASDTFIGDANDNTHNDTWPTNPGKFEGFGGDDCMVGNAGNDELRGDAGNDTLFGDSTDPSSTISGNDTLNGGDGIDSMIGGPGDDLYYVSQTGDSVVEALNGGNDTVLSEATSYTLPGNVEDLVFTGIAPSATTGFTGSGNDLANHITGGDTISDNNSGTYGGNDTLEGFGGDDTLDGLSGNDSLEGDSGSGNDVLNGGTGNDTLLGGAGNDTLDGGDGTDTAVFSHAWINYTISGTGPFSISDNSVIAPDGTDSVSNVENFQFANGTFAASAIANDAPTNIGLSGSSIAENTTNGTVVGSLSSIDPDAPLGDTAVYSLVDNAGGRFGISGTDLYVANGSLLDYETATSHSITVRVTDAHGATFDKVLSIGVTDVNDNAPVFVSGTTATEAENTTPAHVVYDANATDADGTAANNTIAYSLSSSGDSALFSIDGQTGEVRFLASPDFEAPADANHDNVYDIVVHANDGVHDVTQNVAVTVTDVTEILIPPVFTSGTTASEAENSAATNVVYTASATDTNPLTYSLSSGGDNALFSINATTGEVRFLASPDYENPSDAGNNNVYDIVVHANDSVNDVTQNVAISVTDVNDNAPVFLSGTTASEAENTAATHVVYDANATDADGTAANNTIVYSLSSGGDNALFSINAATGEVRFLASPDFETPADANHDNVYDIVVHANDGVHNVTQNVAVTVTDVNENVSPPVFTSGTTASETENTAATNVVYAASATDANPLTYSLSSGGDNTLFSIDAATGEVRFLASPNYENPSDAGHNNVYDIVVHANDGVNDVTQNVAISVTDVNEFAVSTPVDSNATANAVNENVANGTLVGITAHASDADGTTNTVTYSLTNDAAGRFAIDANTGVVTVAGAIDRETSGPSLGITVHAASADGSSSDQTFTIAINDLNDNAPVFDSGATATTAENIATSTVVYDANAHDDDATAANNTIAFSLSAGGDNDLFTIDSATGAVRFKVSPDYENPADADANNVYNVVVHASDGVTDTTKAVAISVTDAVDVITGDGGDNSLTGQSGADSIIGFGGNDTLNGLTGADTMVGGLGNDTYYVDNASDVVTENATEGTDTVDTTLGVYVLGSTNGSANVENVTFIGAGAFQGYGTAADNSMVGGSGDDSLVAYAGNDTLDGGAGADTMYGGIGNDIYFVDNANDSVVEYFGEGTDTVLTALGSFTLAANVENMTFTDGTNHSGTGNTSDNYLIGNSGADTLLGLSGNDTLDGGAGADSMAGGVGNDTYYVDAADTVSENTNEGTDTIITTLGSYTLGSNLENLTFTDSADHTGSGNGLSNILTGGAGNDTLTDDVGSDVLNGGDGNDSLSSGAGADIVNGGTGNDTLDGGDGADNLSGNDGNDSIIGGAANDILNGGAGNDTMVGGVGNDNYYVDNASDVVIENGGEGTDAVYSSAATYTLADNVENLALQAGATPGPTSGTGNSAANIIIVQNTSGASASGAGGNDTITGGSGADTIDGGAGADSMTGGTGADVFVFHKGEADQDKVADFSHAASDQLQFVGYSAGSTLTHASGADWLITDGITHTTETIHLTNNPASLIAGDDYVFF
ncbi:MAG TPA: cadherin domain-containing protein, partial [Micropepsaceae bacterium]|nr:cadherin domain-containing protein [Micropepsaceae bacterium]